MSQPEQSPPDYPEQWPREPRGPSLRRSSLYLAAFLVIAIAGAALFVSGVTLGRLQAATPGTSDSRQQLFQPFWDAYNDIAGNYVGEVDERKLVQGAIKGVFSALEDPFSAYMTEEEYRNSLSNVSGEFEGIGAELATLDPEGAPCATISPTCRLTVTRVLRQSPALAAGLAEGDVIVAVDGTATVESSLELVIPQIRGPKGSTVKLTVERTGELLDLSIVRNVIRSEHVRSEAIADGRVGYIRVTNFSAGAASDLRDQLRELVKEQAVKGLILDLRDDPGGYVDAARRIASEFQDNGPLYWEQAAGSDPVPSHPEPGGVATDPALPMVVLVNGGTASASEIVAAALQETGRALLVGEQTFGKGTIQEWKELPGAGGYRLSVRKWLTPDQRWTHGQGLTPDIVVEPPAEPEPGSDPVLDRALELLTKGSAGGLRLAA
ncbi:MAG TPA: S41 family peptidase [Candidatus Caenarcaniphilales bacterium]|nr:S41 family peptidase [Candidatus Caenarcaniphilales bacterium]